MSAERSEFRVALPRTFGNVLWALLDARILRTHRTEFGKMVSETTAEVRHFITPPTIEEGVHFWGDKPVEPGTKVIIYDRG